MSSNQTSSLAYHTKTNMAERLKAHAIIFPFPYQGHINPSINLALKLASKGFVVTFVHLEFVHHTLSKSHYVHDKTTDEVDIFSKAHQSGIDIRYATISDGFPVEYDRFLHLEEYWESMLRDFPARVDEFVGKIIQSHPCLVHFLVADTLYSWPATIAEKYNLVNVSFRTETALVFSLIYHSELLRQHGHFPCKDNIEEINYIPGVKSINTRDFMPYLKEAQATAMLHKVVFTAFREVDKADFILHNTVQELESEILSALNKYQRNYAIGPVNFSKNLTTNSTSSKSLLPESDCTRWLDSKSPGSVLYVSFGSLVQISKQVFEEVAYGLLLSEVNFIWVVRPGIVASGDANVLPAGFENAAKDKGLIVPWCNQVMVLSNPAVGGFFTHCGWNSVLESIWCGTPMICYPIRNDQPINRKLVVDDWKIGINLCDGSSLDREEVAQKIKILMSGTISKGLNQRIMEVRAKLHNAVEMDGSSDRNFDQFIEDLKERFEATITEK